MRTAVALVACFLAGLGPALAQAPGPARRSWAALATADGVRATLHRWGPDSPASRAILLLPDVGTTSHLFDFDGRGLAPYLVRAGFAVFALDYRGAGRSQVPYGGYRLEDLLDKDAEAAFARVLEGRERISLAGLGLGATFALALAARHPEQVDFVVALQPLVAPDAPGEPAARALERAQDASAWIDLATQLRAPLFFGRSAFEVLLANDASLDASRLDALRLHVLAPVPRTVALQVAQAVRERRLVIGVPVARLLEGWRGPTLLLIAPRDNWIHPEFALPARELVAGARCELRVLDPLSGAKRDYGHLGMLLGQEASEDVFSPVARFLDARP